MSRLFILGYLSAFLFLICGASRLARFNISVNPQPRNPGRPGKKYFVGMPIPAGAGVIASVVHFESGSPIEDPRLAVVWLCLILFTGFLMVSTWRFWSGKEISLGQRHPFQLVAVIVAIGVLDCAVFGVYADHHCAWDTWCRECWRGWLTRGVRKRRRHECFELEGQR